jgi:TonB family protein
MNSLYAPEHRGRRVRGILQGLFAALFVVFTIGVQAQQPQLTLADILIGLRSKKVTLEERNVILAGAVRERGITFAMTPEIEKELAATGASKVLIEAVREKAIAAAPAETPTPTPAPTPVPDFAFFKTRADGSLSRGEFALALPDYDKALSLKPDNAVAFLNRGRTYYSLKDYPKATADLNRSIELDPKDSKAYYSRAVLFESQGELEKALADYQKSADLDPASEAAKAMAKKVADQLEARKAVSKPPTPEPPKVEPVAVRPESVDVGSLSAANAVKMVKPFYPAIAQKSSVEGKVVVEVELDTEGNVVKAKAISGHQLLRRAAEDAASKSKFQPAMFNGTPIKGTGTITYGFSLRPGGE